MLVFQKLRYKNFLSSGDSFTEIDFLANNTNLIIGSNGSGKSTILDALTFVFFNKPFRKINKPQLVNSVTEKNCLVEIEFNNNNRQYLVRRGIKPNVFDIEVDGKLLEKRGDDRDNQVTLEENILKVNYKSFTQIVILGSSTFVPFMQLSAAHRREVIEDLLDIRVFSSMSSIVKDRVRTVRDQLKILELKKSSLKEKGQMQAKFIDDITKSGEANINKKNESVKRHLLDQQQLQEANIDVLGKIDHLNAELEELKGAGDKLRELGGLKGKIQQKITTLSKNHKFFNDNKTCPTCTQDIDENLRQTKLTELGVDAKKLKGGYQELEAAIEKEENRESNFNDISAEVLELNKKLASSNSDISNINKTITNLHSEISTIRESIDNQAESKENLNSIIKNLKSSVDEISNLKVEMEKHQFVNELLKDGGVKTSIIKKYIPLINKHVNKYLQMMEFYINFNLDEEFNETVVSPIHERFSYASFSEGEKMRIDLSLLFTWREVARVRNSINTNLLIMDEVFDSSLDGFGTEEFLKIIRYVVKDANIFIISHKTELYERFDSVLKFEKERGFSKLNKK
ncbi:MAG: recombinase [Gammaproteobacteria bacterium]|nr:recombinase [Gammaproteobacteria bacterium]